MVTAMQSAVAPVLDMERPCIAILLGAPLNVQNLERVGVPYLSPHANIIIFDCKPWLGRSDEGLHHEGANWNAVVVVNSAAALKEALRTYRPNFAIDYIGLGSLTPSLQRMLAAAGTCFVVQKSGSFPQPSLWARVAWKLTTQYRAPKPAVAGPVCESTSKPATGLMARMQQRATAAWTLRRTLLAPDLALLAGSASINHFTRRARKILWIGSQDYHIYRRALASPDESLPAGPYVVFIDDNLPYASDWSLLDLPAPVTPNRYYPAMQRLFSQLKAQWGMPVVIAAHPSARHDERVREGFGGFMLIHGCTADLVRGAQAVLIHGSTAVSFAIMSDKPLLFLSSEELLRSPYGLHIRTIAKQLRQVPFNIDRDDPVPDLPALAPQQRLYAQYTDRYLCRTGSAEARPWQAFIGYIGRATPDNTGSKNTN